MTRRYSRALEKLRWDYDGILQIGSLLGPVHNPGGKPYFSYHDTTVHSVESMWRPWIPDDFDRVREEFYRLESHMFSSMTHLFTYSRFAGDSLARFYQVPPEKISIVGSSLKMPEEAVPHRKRGTRDLLFVSSDFRRKGGWLLLPIMKEVLSVFPDATMTVVGRVPSSWRVAMPSSFRSTGPLPRQEVARTYRQASLLVHPAQFDPFPSVILEAANSRVPAVASRVCGIPEMVRDGKTGYLASPERADEFARRIIFLLRNPDRLKAMGDSARSHVRKSFHPDVVAGKMAGVMTALLGEAEQMKKTAAALTGSTGEWEPA